MFAALFVIFGIALVPVFDRTLRALARGTLISRALAVLGAVVAALFVGFGLVSGLSALTSAPTSVELITLLALVLIVAAFAARALVPGAASAPWRLPSYGLLVAALLVGAATTLLSVLRILG
jgi:hypothetical protein